MSEEHSDPIRVVDAAIRELQTELREAKAHFTERFFAVSEAERQVLVIEFLLHQFDALARAAWCVVPYREGVANYEAILERSIFEEFAPRIAKLTEHIPDRMFLPEATAKIGARLNWWIAQAERARLGAEAEAGDAARPKAEADAAAATEAPLLECVPAPRSPNLRLYEAWRRREQEAGRKGTQKVFAMQAGYSGDPTELRKWLHGEPVSPRAAAEFLRVSSNGLQGCDFDISH